MSKELEALNGLMNFIESKDIPNAYDYKDTIINALERLENLEQFREKVNELFKRLEFEEDFDIFDQDDIPHTYRFYYAKQEENCYITSKKSCRLIYEIIEELEEADCSQ